MYFCLINKMQRLFTEERIMHIKRYNSGLNTMNLFYTFLLLKYK